MEFVIGLGLFICVVLVLRVLGAWMLRINEVINLQKEMLEEIRRLRGSEY